MTTPSPSISPLRQRMMDDMRMRRLAPTTQANYYRQKVVMLSSQGKRFVSKASALGYCT